jgi:hypothetical protein
MNKINCFLYRLTRAPAAAEHTDLDRTVSIEAGAVFYSAAE